MFSKYLTHLFRLASVSTLLVRVNKLCQAAAGSAVIDAAVATLLSYHFLVIKPIFALFIYLFLEIKIPIYRGK